ncbi:MAG: hypothetical protein ABEJ56_06485, partial [Candidatus Nanohaloarchaea archaeon]
MKQKIVIGVLVIIAGGLANAKTYSSSPVSDSFSGGYLGDGEFEYKAGEFQVETEGVLPPANEKLKITSRARKSGWNEIYSGYEGPKNADGSYDTYNAWQPDIPGYYKVKANVTLSSTKKYVYGSTETSKGKLRVWKEARGFCNGNFYSDVDGKIQENDWPQCTTWSEKCGCWSASLNRALYDGGTTQNWGIDWGGTWNLDAKNTDKSWSYSYAGSSKEREIFDFVHDEISLDSPDSKYATRSNTTKDTYTGRDTVLIQKVKVDGKRGDRKDNTIIESLNFRVNGQKKFRCTPYECYSSVSGGVKINNFSVNYFQPIGSTLVDVGGETFTSGVSSFGGFETSVGGGDSGRWIDSGRSVDLDLNGRFESLGFDDSRTLIVSGLFKASSPPGVSPEAYRLVNEDTGSVVFKFDGLDSSDDDYVRRRKKVDLSKKEFKSGSYRLEVRNDASYPVEFGVRDFEVRNDGYIRYKQQDSYSPELELGSNSVEVLTSGSNVLDYSFSWSECTKDEIVSSRSPGDGKVVNSLSPSLTVSHGCSSYVIDSVRFRDARTGTVIREFSDVSSGNSLSVGTDLSVGDTYSWYVEFCDQGKCWESDTWGFTVGERRVSDSKVSRQEFGTKGLKQGVRDEDGNKLGGSGVQRKTGLTGFVNKLEEQSDQLQSDADSTLDTGAEMWNNSVGSKNNADQFAITPGRDWVVSNTGKPYPPWGSYYRDADVERPGPESSSVLKESKVFGNSLAVVASRDVRDDVDGDGSK